MPVVAMALLWLATGLAAAQNPRDAERRLEKVRGELKSVAEERHQLEGKRGDAARQLRDADEKVAATGRSLAQTQQALRQHQQTLAELEHKRDALRARLTRQHAELAQWLRAAYAIGDNAPLKLLLAQDRVADANRLLTYHRYLQRERAQRIASLTHELQALEQVQRDVAQQRQQLSQAQRRQQEQAAALQRDRKQRASVVLELDQRYQDRSEREKALGQDAKALETLLANLRAAAARAEAERRAAAKRAAAEQAAQARAGNNPHAGGKVPPKVMASGPPLKVGGLGWPLSGDLLARYGGRLPDGRTSNGVLIAAPAGSTITAVADGTVVFSEWMTGYGMILIVDHGNGYMSLYAHNDTLLRDAGDRVKRGDPVAKVGNSGGQGRPALYFELRHNGQPVDPASWLQRR
ncbi:peptidoglycan DD-metalloendopeptidase family protein [Xanthomonas sp. MUS 060]|uniref:murein hydrolase activator EnvC family protein n=1 Tax=Xanthomonas sp. MUS 060 TaxID=1588031 RepID=UPI0005F28B1A|nr:peptidoglycan DD-metalloendopeptidase family protein [Xanthomonas sp. MUS 060]